MSKKSVTLYSVILASGILLGLIAGVLWVKDSSETGPVFMPGLNVLGDVSKPFELKDMRVFDQESFEYKGDKYSGIPLASLIIESEPWMENGEDNEILIIGEDGLSASLSGGDLTSCYILFSEKNGWEAINVNHPVSSNIKRIQEIVVIAVDPPMDHSVNIITPENNLASFTPGGIYKEITRIYPYYEGTSSVTKDGTERSASIYTRRMLLPLEDISPGFTGKKMIAMKTGEYLYINSRGYLNQEIIK